MGRRIRPFEPVDKEERLQKYFKTIRMATGMSPAKLAEQLGCSRQLVNQIESGDSKVSYLTYLGVEGVVLNSSRNNLLQDLWDILVDNDGYSEDFRELVKEWGTIIGGALAYGAIDEDKAIRAWQTVLAEL